MAASWKPCVLRNLVHDYSTCPAPVGPSLTRVSYVDRDIMVLFGQEGCLIVQVHCQPIDTRDIRSQHRSGVSDLLV